VVPPNHHLWSAIHQNDSKLSAATSRDDPPSRLLEHVEHLRLEHMVDRFDRHCRARLGHREDINAGDLPEMSVADSSDHDARTGATAHSVVIHELSQHQTHDLHRHTRSSMLEHLLESA
jgi:hypothetical protein